MSSLDNVVSKLRGVRSNSNGYRAFCPVHQANHDPQSRKGRTLSIAEEGGKVLVNCFAGCTFQQISGALNMKECEFFTANRLPNPRRNKQKTTQQKPERSFDTPEDALNACGSQFVTPFPDNIYRYLSADGVTVGAVGRWNIAGGKKEIRPVKLQSGRWIIGAMDSPRPLYNLPAILEAVRSGQTVYVVEGEKAADALIGIGIVATTSAGGAETFKSADWQPLKGAIVRIWPDNDQPGEKYALNVLKILRNIGAAARIVRPFNLGLKEDAFDWIERQREANPEYATPETLREEIDRECASYLERYPDESETAAPSASAADSSANVTTEAIECNETEDDEDDGGEAKETPFPIHCLGERLREFVESHASAIGVPYSFLALPVITILGSLLCGKRRLEVADTWYVHPVFWAAIVAPSGSRKSSGYMPATEEIKRLNDVEQKRYDKACARYLEKLKKYERGEIANMPLKPRQRRVYVADATYEGLIRQMDKQQSPLLVVCDELNQWINSFTRYNNNSAINGWLSLHKLGPQIVTRADDSKNYNIPRAAASVFGTIQTDRFVEAMASDEFINSGFLARCLFTFAKSERQPFRKKSPHPIEGPAENYNKIVRNLHALPHPKSKEKPHTSTMTQGADEVWARWYNGTMNELRKESEQWPERSKQRSAWNSGLEKIEELPARLAIVLHAVDCIGPDQNAGDLNTPVSGETMANAINIATWFVQGLRRVTRLIADQPANNRPTYRPQTPEEYVLSKFHQEEKERLEIRDILRKCRRYDAVDQLKPVLDSLVQNASLIVEPGETKSGKTTKFYRLP